MLVVAFAVTAPPVAADPLGDIRAELNGLEIKGRAPKAGYHRSEFGDAWTDDVNVAGGHNGCDTRNDVSVGFQRGEGTSAEVQIDHIVALSDAWQKGAAQWDSVRRQDFANDPRNLQATLGWINKQKGDGDAATWLPPNKSYRCAYVSRIVDVKSAYGLWVTQAEYDAIARVLDQCG